MTPSRLVSHIKQSDIRAMTRECNRIGGINMAQGLCDLPVPEPVIQGAQQAMQNAHNSYTTTEGILPLREAIANKMQRFYNLDVDPEREVLISLGATGAFYATAQTVLDPGDGVILLEPYYGYHAATLQAMGCELLYICTGPPGWSLNWDEMAKRIKPNTKAIVINTPANPSGKVFSSEEIDQLANFASAHHLIVISDEMYEHFVYDGLKHTPLISHPDLRKRTITVSGFSKIFSITGWRLGYAILPTEFCELASQINDLIYVCPPAPLQHGVVCGLQELGMEYYTQVAQEHQRKRDRFCNLLESVGLTPYRPSGAYYVLANISSLPGEDDVEKTRALLQQAKVAAVPARAFYHAPTEIPMARFCFSKTENELEQACENLSRILK